MKSSATLQFCPNCAWNARVVSNSAKYDLSGQNKVDSRCCQVLLDSYPGPELQGWAFFPGNCKALLVHFFHEPVVANACCSTFHRMHIPLHISF